MCRLDLTNGNTMHALMAAVSWACWGCSLDDVGSPIVPKTACATHLPFLQFALGLRDNPHWRRDHAFHLSASCPYPQSVPSLPTLPTVWDETTRSAAAHVGTTPLPFLAETLTAGTVEAGLCGGQAPAGRTSLSWPSHRPPRSTPRPHVNEGNDKGPAV